MPPLLNPRTTIFFLCDIQTRFSKAIHAYDQVVVTANKLVKLAKIFDCEVVATTQNARALGSIDPQIDTRSLGPLYLGPFDKTRFSMLTQDVKILLDARPHVTSVVIFGIESHICISQTALSLLELSSARDSPLVPYLPLDGISSCNSFEVEIAMSRLRQAGAIITSSESLAFELMGDASLPKFKEFSKFVKEEKERTKNAGDVLIWGRQTNYSPTQNVLAGGGVLMGSKPNL